MNKLMKKMLTDKSARDTKMLTILMLSLVAVPNTPWLGSAV